MWVITFVSCLQRIRTEQRQFEKWVLTGEGEEIVQHGSHEARLFNAVNPQDGSPQAELMVCVCVHTCLR